MIIIGIDCLIPYKIEHDKLSIQNLLTYYGTFIWNLIVAFAYQ